MNTTDFIPVGSEMLGEPALRCPVCESQYVHPEAVECRSPGTKHGFVRIDCDGIAMDPRVPPVRRGTQITLAFAGECGHRFEYVFHFHKGATLVARSMRECPRDEKHWPMVIWRS